MIRRSYEFWSLLSSTTQRPAYRTCWYCIRRLVDRFALRLTNRQVHDSKLLRTFLHHSNAGMLPVKAFDLVETNISSTP
jgi:hypothetical protein